ncbi:hypothetical protein RZS08_63955, partial [Arthrospira platensis SPKY1]|nr:hypothetical protein [Arthrospira platensis SPKY1]
MSRSNSNFFPGWFIIPFILVFAGCRKQNVEIDINVLEQEIFGLATPVKLNYDTTIVFLGDYFINTA